MMSQPFEYLSALMVTYTFMCLLAAGSVSGGSLSIYKRAACVASKRY